MNVDQAEQFYNRLKEHKVNFFNYMIYQIPESHSLFSEGHISDIKRMDKRKIDIERRSLFGTVLTVLFLETYARKKNLMYRLTFVPKLRYQMMKFFFLPFIVSSYLGINYERRMTPAIEEIVRNYDFSDEKFRQIFVDHQIKNKNFQTKTIN